MPYPKDPRHWPQAKGGTEKLEAAETRPLKVEDLRALGKDQFTASAALRAGTREPARPARDVEAGKARIRELHQELARAKATILDVRPRMAILKRAMRLNEGKTPQAVLFHNIPPGEQTFTRQVAARLAENGEAARMSAIATGQYESAWEAMRAVEEAIAEAELGPPEEALSRLSGLSVEKMRGQVFPLTSLHVHFETDPVLSRLFPPPHLLRPKGTGKLEPYTLSDLFRPGR